MRSGGKRLYDPADTTAQRLLAAIDAVSAAEGHLASNVNLALLLENLVAQMSSDPAMA